MFHTVPPCLPDPGLSDLPFLCLDHWLTNPTNLPDVSTQMSPSQKAPVVLCEGHPASFLLFLSHLLFFLAPVTVCNHFNLISPLFQNHLTPNSETSHKYISTLWITTYRGKMCFILWTTIHTVSQGFRKIPRSLVHPSIFSLQCQLWLSKLTLYLTIEKTQSGNSTKVGCMPTLFLSNQPWPTIQTQEILNKWSWPSKWVRYIERVSIGYWPDMALESDLAGLCSPRSMLS